MDKYIDVHTLYNLINQSHINPYICDPYYLLLLDVRDREEYDIDHIKHAIYFKRNNDNKFTINFEAGLEWKWNIVVYDQDTFNIDSRSRISKSIDFLMMNGSFCKVRALKGGFRYFTKLYPYMRTQKILYLPQELESDKTYPLEVIYDFLYLGTRDHSNTQKILKDLKIFGKIYCSVDDNISLDEPEESYYLVQLDDSGKSSMYQYMEQACAFLQKHRNRSHRILIVCDLNLGRGVTLAMAYLIKEGKKTTKQAWDYMKMIRLPMHPNWGCIDQLVLFEQTVNGLESKPTINDHDFT